MLLRDLEDRTVTFTVQSLRDELRQIFGEVCAGYKNDTAEIIEIRDTEDAIFALSVIARNVFIRGGKNLHAVSVLRSLIHNTLTNAALIFSDNM